MRRRNRVRVGEHVFFGGGVFAYGDGLLSSSHEGRMSRLTAWVWAAMVTAQTRACWRHSGNGVATGLRWMVWCRVRSSDRCARRSCARDGLDGWITARMSECRGGGGGLSVCLDSFSTRCGLLRPTINQHQFIDITSIHYRHKPVDYEVFDSMVHSGAVT